MVTERLMERCGCQKYENVGQAMRANIAAERERRWRRVLVNEAASYYGAGWSCARRLLRVVVAGETDE